ncbi:DUF1080 domain-containing protein [Planctomycetota bacterium]
MACSRTFCRAGWLELRQEKGYLDADMLWRGGSVMPVDHVYLQDQTLVVERHRLVTHKPSSEGAEPRKHTKVQRVELKHRDRDTLEGVSLTARNNGLGVDTVTYIATRIADLPPAPNLQNARYGDPIEFFNGENLEGWQVMNPGAGNGWRVENGILVNDPDALGKKHTSNLRTIATFEDFRLTLEVNVPQGSNSGVYLRGVYEVQVQDSYGKPCDSHNMGAIYSRITPRIAAEKPAGQWQALDIILCDRHATVKLNGQTIVDNQPLYGITGGALWADESKPGPIYLQGDHGPVSFRNIVFYPIRR